MRHDPASAAIVIMLRELKMHGMAHAVAELAEQASPAFESAQPVLCTMNERARKKSEIQSGLTPSKAACSTARTATWSTGRGFQYGRPVAISAARSRSACVIPSCRSEVGAPLR